jgi:Holliday junction resolvase RusA-like endonuclease
MKIDIKPMTVNACWQGRRFKTKQYLAYENDVSLLLRPYRLPEGHLQLVIKVGFSNKLSDVDNMVKPFVDILQKKYEFNDNRIYKLELEKFIVKKGEEYIDFEFKPYGLKSYHKI